MHYEARALDSKQYIDELSGVFERQANDYSRDGSPSPTIGVFAEAALDSIENDDFRKNVEWMIRFRTDDITPKNAGPLLLRAYQADLLQHDPENYPDKYNTKSSWLKAFEDISKDSIREGVLLWNLTERDVQSNIAERYKTIKLLAGMVGERFDRPPSVLDVGSSMLHGDIKLAYNSESKSKWIQFEPVEMMNSDGTESQYDQPEKMRKNRLMTKAANMLLKQNIEFGSMMGVDITNVDDPVIKQWAKSCSFYPDELKDKRKVTEYELLDRLDPHHKRVEFTRADFANLSKAEIARLHRSKPVGGYDMIMFSTVMYQIAPSERADMVANAMRFISPKGLIVIQDSLDGNFSTPYSYTTRVFDMANKESLSWEEIFRWEGGRCKRMAPGIGKLSVQGANVSVQDALLMAGIEKLKAKTA